MDTFARMRQLIGTTADWAANNIVLGSGEIGVEVVSSTDIRLKVGNGTSTWSALSYASSSSSSISTAVQTALDAKLTVADYVVRETPSGSVNGTNTSFTLAFTPVSGSESVFLNGILQEPGSGNDYTIAADTITFLFTPVSGDKIRVSYIK